MGSLRFRKQLRLAPGLKLTLNKQSVSMTMGIRGAHLTYNTKGQRTVSVGLPGTGLSYRDTRKVGPRVSWNAGARQAPDPNPVSWVDVAAAAAGIYAEQRTADPEPQEAVTDRAWVDMADQGDPEQQEAAWWIDAQQQEADAIEQWRERLFAWAGADPARLAVALDAWLTRVFEWRQSAVDLGQRNRFVRAGVEASEAGFESMLATDVHPVRALLAWVNWHQEWGEGLSRHWQQTQIPWIQAHPEDEPQVAWQMVQDTKAWIREAVLKATMKDLDNPELPDYAQEVMQEYARDCEAMCMVGKDGQQVRVLDIVPDIGVGR